MSLRQRRFTLIQLLMIVSTVLFTNCGGFQKTDESSVSATAQFNGGGHSGKVTYLNMQLEGDMCVAPTRGLEMIDGSTQAVTYGCSGTSQDPFDISRLISYAFDSNFLIFDEHIYAKDDLLKLEANERAQFTIYCASAGDQVSFALKSSRFATATGPMSKSTGYLTADGTIADETGIYKDRGAMGERHFSPDGGEYDFILGAPTSPTRAQGEIIFNSTGKHVSLECYTKDRLTNTDETSRPHR